MVQFVHRVLFVTIIIITASLCVPRGVALNVLVTSDQGPMRVQAREYLNVSTGFYLVLQPDCNLILYNRSHPIMSTNTTCTSAMFAPQLGSVNETQTNVTISILTSSDTSLTTSGPLSLWLTHYINYGGPSGSSTSEIWSHTWGGDSLTTGPLFPYMILRANGSCDFYDFNGNYLNGNQSLLRPYWGPVPRRPPSANATDLSNMPDIAYPFPPELAWKPQTSLNGFPYIPSGYYISQGSKLQTVDQRFELMLGRDCILQSKATPSNGSKQILWEAGSRNYSSWIQGCELMLQEDGRLVIRNNVSGVVYWNVSTASGNNSVSWILRLSSTDGGLTISDIENPNNVLWTNIHPNRTGQSPQTNRPTTGIVAGVTSGVFVLAMAGLLLFYFYARTYILDDPAEKALRRRLEETGGKPQTRFSEANIKQATNNFGNGIGSGGFGDVFYGKLPDGQEIAAKVLSAESQQSKQEFYNEVELLSVVHHKYLVSLLGYRCTRRQQILVYEYMSGGDLRHRLQGASAAENPLTWKQRTSIALQVAEGLEYLHDKCSPSIIHRDVKSTNILLTEKMVAKVADFGLSKLRKKEQQDATHVTTVVKGTPGYLDPEYHETGMLTDKSDVYAFGIVLMELLTGQNQIYIANRVAEAWNLELGVYTLPDPNLKGEYDIDEFVDLIELSLWCVRKRSGERPFMRQVVQRLREMGLVPLEPSQPASELRLGDEDSQVIMPLNNELESSEEFEHSYALPVTDSSSSAMSLEFWRSGAQFRRSGR